MSAARSSSPGAAARKLRVLCLHGFQQTGAVFKDRTGSLRKALKAVADLEYVTAPLTIAPSEIEGFEENEDGSAANTWWYPNRDRSEYRDVDTTLGFLQTVFAQQGPFDGVLGFSQGAAMTAMMCAYKQREGYEWMQFGFAVLVSGFKPIDPVYHKLLFEPATQIDMPTLHVFGEGDVRVSPERSRALADAFKEPVVYPHAGGQYVHQIYIFIFFNPISCSFVPADAASKAVYVSFLSNYLSRS